MTFYIEKEGDKGSWPTSWRYGKKREHSDIIIFPERKWNFTSRKKMVREHHRDLYLHLVAGESG